MSRNLEDLHVDRNCVVNAIEENSAGVVEIKIQAYVVPTQQLEPEEYNSQVSRIITRMKRILSEYVMNNLNDFLPNKIIDINFTSANLRKGYNKNVTVSLFVRKRYDLKIGKTRKMVKDGIRQYVSNMIGMIKSEVFKCYKRKQVVNSRQV